MSPLPSGFSPGFREEGSADFGAVQCPEAVWLSLLHLTFLEGDEADVWRLTWKEEESSTEERELILAEQQMDSLVVIYHQVQEGRNAS